MAAKKGFFALFESKIAQAAALIAGSGTILTLLVGGVDLIPVTRRAFAEHERADAQVQGQSAALLTEIKKSVDEMKDDSILICAMNANGDPAKQGMCDRVIGATR